MEIHVKTRLLLNYVQKLSTLIGQSFLNWPMAEMTRILTLLMSIYFVSPSLTLNRVLEL